jgi:hypothetical protein
MDTTQTTTRAASAAPLDGAPDDWVVFPSQGTHPGGGSS